MKFDKLLQYGSRVGSLALTIAIAWCAPSARANVYATNIKIDGVLTGTTNVAQGTSVTITYILNEPASAGVTIKILTAELLVRTINIAGGNPGTTGGLNTVVWDGKNDLNLPVPPGTYFVSITAASTGYTHWTQITTDTNAGNQVNWPSGIAVDLNTNSPYYGRVMIGNGGATAGSAGVVKCNADGSFADEGQSNAGYSFPTDGVLGDSVRSMKYIDDDRVVFNQWTGNGQIAAVDMIMSTNQILWDSANVPGAPFVAAMLNGFAAIDVSQPGNTNAAAYLADFHYPSIGVWMWPLTNNGTYDPNFGGVEVLQSSGSCAVTLRTGLGLMVDDNNDLFMGQVRSHPFDPVPRLFAFTNWPSGPAPLCSQNLNWSVGAADPLFSDINDLCMDSRRNPTYISAAFSGGNGGMTVLYATNGAVVATLQVTLLPPGLTGISVSGGTVKITFTGGDDTDVASDFQVQTATALSSATSWSTVAGATFSGTGGSYTASLATSGAVQFYRIAHGVYYISTSWDNVGNVYGGTGAHVWRAFSPPGANQATTLAVATVQIHL